MRLILLLFLLIDVGQASKCTDNGSSLKATQLLTDMDETLQKSKAFLRTMETTLHEFVLDLEKKMEVNSRELKSFLQNHSTGNDQSNAALTCTTKGSSETFTPPSLVVETSTHAIASSEEESSTKSPKGCEFTRILNESLYEQYFTNFPQSIFGETFHCSPQPYWAKFRTHRIGFRDVIYIQTENGLEEIEQQTLKCVKNEDNAGHHFVTAAGKSIQSHQLECAYKKCSEFHNFDPTTGECKLIRTSSPETCAIGVVKDVKGGNIATYEVSLGNDLPFPHNITHTAIREGCWMRLMHYDYSSTEFIFQGLYANQWEHVPNHHDGSLCPTKQIYPFETGCYCTKSVVLRRPDDIPRTHIVSHESLFMQVDNSEKKIDEFSIADDGKNNQHFFSGTASFSLVGLSTYGNVILTFYKLQSATAKQTESLQVKLDFQQRTIEIHVFGNLVAFLNVADEAGTFSLHITKLLHIPQVMFNGRAIPFPGKKLPKISRITIQKHNVNVLRYNWFNSKNCPEYHEFDERSGDCKFTGEPKYCAIMGYAYKDSPWLFHTSGVVHDSKKIRKVQARAGCICTLRRMDNSIIKIREDDILTDMHYYTLNSNETGTCTQEEAAKIDCQDLVQYNPNTHPVFGTAPYIIDFEPLHINSSITVKGNWSCIDDDCNIELWLKTKGVEFPILSIVFYGYDHAQKTRRTYKDDGVSPEILMYKNNIFELRLTMNETGFEVLCGGRFFKFYARSKSSLNNIHRMEVMQSVQLTEWRRQEEVAVPYKHYFAHKLRFGEYIYINGIPTDESFHVTIGNSEIEILFDLEFKELTVVHSSYDRHKKSITTEESPVGLLKKNVEFDLVIVNKPHAFEVYVNGELLKPTNHINITPIADDTYGFVRISGNVRVFEVRVASHY